MPILPEVLESLDELTQIRHDIYAHPELGSGEGGGFLHNARYDFNDTALPYGVSFFVRVAERFLEKTE